MHPTSRHLWIVVAVLLVWASVNLLLVYQHEVLPKAPLSWDEASHGLLGLIIASDIRAGDLPALFFDSYRQVYWPPVFSWVSGSFFYVFGATTEIARLSSLVWMIPLPIMLFLAGRRVMPARPWVAGVLAAVLALTSLSLADMASYALVEAPGIMALSAGIWLYFRLLDRPTIPGAIALGAAMTVTYLTKSNYGVLLVLAVVIERLFHARLNLRVALWEAPGRYAFSVLGGSLLLWFAYPPKLRSSWTALVNYPYGPFDAYSLDGLLYYPRALAAMIGPVWLLAVVLVASAVTFTRLSDPKLRFLVVLMLLQMAFATWSGTKLERHIVTMLPPLFLLTAYWISWLAQRLWRERTRAANCLAVLVPLLIVAGSSLTFYTQVLAIPAGPGSPEAFGLVRYLADLGRRAGPLLVASSVDAQPPILDWYLATEGGMPVFSAGSLNRHDEVQWGAMRTILPPLAEVMARLPDRGRGTSVTRSLYSGIPMEAPEFLTEKDYVSGVLDTAAEYRARSVAVVRTQEGAHLYEKGLLETGLLSAGYRMADSQDFPYAAAVVRLYAR